MKKYDQCISLGSSCGATMALRNLDLQGFSLPFDWLYSPGLPQVVSMIEADFGGWFERKDLVLWDVSHEKGVIHRFYKNIKTGFGFPHDFSNAEPFETNYDGVREKYARRTERFARELSVPKRVLFVYLERVDAGRLPDDVLCEMKSRLDRKFPLVTSDLIYIYPEPGRTEAQVSDVSAAITVLGVDYRVYHREKFMHLTNTAMLTQCLAGRAALTHPPTKAALKEAQRREREKWLKPFGTNPLVRRFNRLMQDWYCKLEDYLVEQHLLPGDKAIWYEGDGM